MDGLSYNVNDDEEGEEGEEYEEEGTQNQSHAQSKLRATGQPAGSQNDNLSLMQRQRALSKISDNQKQISNLANQSSLNQSAISNQQRNISNQGSLISQQQQQNASHYGNQQISPLSNTYLQSNNYQRKEEPSVKSIKSQPKEAFDEAYNRGRKVTSEDEKQIYMLKQENERYVEDNILLKAENDRLVKLIYDKEKADQQKYYSELDIKDKKIKKLDIEIEQYKKIVEELRIDLVSKQLDRDSLKAQLINKSFSPILFLNDYSRNEFWKMITRYESDALTFQEDKITIQQEILEQRSIIARQETEIQDLKKQLDDYFVIRSEFTKMKMEYDKLYDRYSEVEHLQKETNLKFSGLEKSYFFLEKERESSHSKIQELSNLLHERSIESNNEKKALREFLQRLEQEKGLAEEANKREKDFSSYRIGAKVSRPFNLSDYFVRLKTTSISSEKYAETIDILFELLKTEQANSLKTASKTDSTSVSSQLKLKDHYKLFLKAFSSKNSKVLHCCYKIVKELGDIEDRVEEFVENQASAALIKTYKTTDDYAIKQDTLYFLKNFMSKVCKFSQGHSDKAENKIHSMNCIVYLAKTQENRQALSNYDVFNIVMTNLIRSVESKERKVANAAIGALAYFSFERAYRILLANANQLFNFYELLLQSIQGSASGGNATGAVDIPASTRYAAAVIIAKMLGDKDLFGVHDSIMKEGVLTYLAKGLRDKQSSVKKECAQIVIHLSKYIDNKPESFRPLINPLISSLGDEDQSLVVKSLDCIRTLSFNDKLRDFIVDNGCVSILCSTIVQELAEVSVEILKHSVSLLVVLISNADARQIMYEASVILPLLSFLSSEDIEVRGLWYEGLKELGAYSNFRAQLENAENSMLILKRAIRQAETTFILQLIAVVRVLCQSPILLDRIIDPVTVPKLFEIYNDAMKWADSNIEIYVLQTLRLLFSNNNGKLHVLKNELMLAYASSCLAKENVNVANEAASLLIEVLQESRKNNFSQLLSFRLIIANIRKNTCSQQPNNIFQDQQFYSRYQSQ
ncbi:UNKNOWN [Stylonychia lemnae]|uniref:Uncharacterized protein n=1 Tax=Stylonychia lemnae TaxID=5949 RepID=A0A078ALG6_STYLE|nr:UNKNOWN [Stylonychia lemnae]|eukprot:CDW82716.1 UNKNOWN [Stylonychia lemnae]